MAVDALTRHASKHLHPSDILQIVVAETQLLQMTGRPPSFVFKERMALIPMGQHQLNISRTLD
jgi:hypothetical protein